MECVFVWQILCNIINGAQAKALSTRTICVAKIIEKIELLPESNNNEPELIIIYMQSVWGRGGGRGYQRASWTPKVHREITVVFTDTNCVHNLLVFRNELWRYTKDASSFESFAASVPFQQERTLFEKYIHRVMHDRMFKYTHTHTWRRQCNVFFLDDKSIENEWDARADAREYVWIWCVCVCITCMYHYNRENERFSAFSSDGSLFISTCFSKKEEPSPIQFIAARCRRE